MLNFKNTEQDVVLGLNKKSKNVWEKQIYESELKSEKFLLGTDDKGRNIYITGNKARQHMLILSSYKNNAENIESMGDNFIRDFISGIELKNGFLWMASNRNLMREDNFFYIKTRFDYILDFGKRNSFNPFLSISKQKDMLLNMIMEISKPYRTEKEAIFQRAFVLYVNLVCYVLVEKFKKNNLPNVFVTADDFHTYCDFEILKKEILQLNNEKINFSFANFLNESNNHIQEVSQFLKNIINTTFKDENGDYFWGIYNDINLDYIIQNRKRLFINIPEGSEKHKIVAKIIMSCIKNYMSMGFGTNEEWSEIIENRSKHIMFCLFDDMDKYDLTEGAALMAAQARSLGFSVIFKAKDIPSLKKSGMKEAESIIANTNTKIFIHENKVIVLSGPCVGILNDNETINEFELETKKITNDKIRKNNIFDTICKKFSVSEYLSGGSGAQVCILVKTTPKICRIGRAENAIKIVYTEKKEKEDYNLEKIINSVQKNQKIIFKRLVDFSTDSKSSNISGIHICLNYIHNMYSEEKNETCIDLLKETGV